jgi:hypothetical protein
MAIEKIVNLSVTDNVEQTTQRVTSLKSELRKAQQEVAQLSDKFGATSKEAVEAAKRAGELKDKIGDAKALTEAFNPDAKFKSLSASLSGVASGFAAYQGALGLAGTENKNLEKQLLKVQSAMALAQGLQGLGEARDSFKQLKAVAIDAFNGIKGAIGATGIGLLVVALGALYANWDKIKESVGGVSQKQKDLNLLSKTNLDQENKKLEAINDQDNILKLQGKSEKDILKIKIAQTDEAINAAAINIENIKITNKEQEKAAKQNYAYLRSFIDFISIPQRFLFENGAKAINKLVDLINKIPGVNINAKLDESFGDTAADYLTKLAFDPEKTKADGEAAVQEQSKVLTKLKNDRAGYQVAINDINSKGSDEASKQAEADAKALAESLRKQQEDTDALKKEVTDAIGTAQDKNNESIISAQEVEKQAVADKYFRLIELAKQFGKDSTDLEIAKANEINDINLKYQQTDYDNRKTQAEKDAELEKNKNDVIAKSKENLTNIISGLESSGLAKTKAGQVLSKAIALTQIGIDSAVAISKASTLANAEGVAAQLAFPTVPGAGTIARVISYASTALSVAANIARAKQLLSSGGGGSVGGSSGGGTRGSGGGGSPAPSFNIVGQNPNNQLAQSIANKQSQPIEAFVVSGNVSNAQSLDRNRITTATFN